MESTGYRPNRGIKELYLFIFESIGTSELLLIGIVALIFLGPRRMPDMARKIGKMMADFRSATNEFKQTWEREVNFEEEAKALRDLDSPDKYNDSPYPVARENTIVNNELENKAPKDIALPEIKAVDPAVFQGLQASQAEPEPTEGKQSVVDVNDKRNWL